MNKLNLSTDSFEDTMKLGVEFSKTLKLCFRYSVGLCKRRYV